LSGRSTDFDHRSGHVFERAIFNNRLLIVIACALLDRWLLGFQATKLAINAGFEKMIPHGHAYIKNYLESRGSLRWPWAIRACRGREHRRRHLRSGLSGSRSGRSTTNCS
jgi:hypothetical protein